MKRFALCAVILLLAAPVAASTVTFTVYPGSKVYHQPKLTPEEVQIQKQSEAKGITQDLWTTPDAFEKVAAFYGKLYKPIQFPTQKGVKWAFFTLDGATNIGTSKRWMKVQRPLMTGFTMQGGQAHNTTVQDTTLIEYVHPK